MKRFFFLLAVLFAWGCMPVSQDSPPAREDASPPVPVVKNVPPPVPAVRRALVEPSGAGVAGAATSGASAVEFKAGLGEFVDEAQRLARMLDLAPDAAQYNQEQVKLARLFARVPPPPMEEPSLVAAHDSARRVLLGLRAPAALISARDRALDLDTDNAQWLVEEATEACRDAGKRLENQLKVIETIIR